MANGKRKMIGFACAYTPLPLLDAAGYTPFRILPMTDCPDHAGAILHDNLCPHIKRILDRALDQDLPDLFGMVFVNSCDAMRRLADAWQKVRSDDHSILLDLPASADERAVSFFASELSRLADALSRWSNQALTTPEIEASIERYNALDRLLKNLRDRSYGGRLKGGSARMQIINNLASTTPVEESMLHMNQALDEQEPVADAGEKVPIYLFGHVLPDPEAFTFFESCGARIVGDDLCTSSRLFASVDMEGPGDIFLKLAKSILSKPACARTIDPANPIKIAEETLADAQSCGARGVIGHTVKFCDPYLARLPVVREVFREKGFPLLLLEGDCTLRSIGQQRTRIEAFVEMLR